MCLAVRVHVLDHVLGGGLRLVDEAPELPLREHEEHEVAEDLLVVGVEVARVRARDPVVRRPQGARVPRLGPQAVEERVVSALRRSVLAGFQRSEGCGFPTASAASAFAVL